MHKMICENPPIERSADAMRILSALARNGLATKDTYGVFTVDWEGVDKARYIRLIGEKYLDILCAWSKASNRAESKKIVCSCGCSRLMNVLLCDDCGSIIIPPRRDTND